ncbi:MAG TPA: hypothetical protein VJ436_00420 [Anaerolineales bacterium]|nr:hypothetical protein [Anaerolineales bacterium]
MVDRRLRLVLLCEPHLLGESLENILTGLPEIDFLGAWPLDEQLFARLAAKRADILLIGDEEKDDHISRLTTQLLDRFPNLMVIRVTLESNILQVYSSQVLPARTATLVDVLRQLPVDQLRVHEEDPFHTNKETPDA